MAALSSSRSLSELPSFDEFQKAAGVNDLMAISASMSFDHETAIGLASRFKEEESFFLLESATEGPRHGARFSFMGFGITASHTKSREAGVESFFGAKAENSSPIRQVAAGLQGLKIGFAKAASLNLRDVEPEKMVGAVGFYSYDIAPDLEPSIGAPLPAKLNLPLVNFVIPEIFMILDQLRRQLVIVSIAPVSCDSLEKCYEASIQKIRKTHSKIIKAHDILPLIRCEFRDRPPDSETLIEAKFLKLAEECREQIRAGEIFQIQIGNRKSYKTKADPFDIFRNLRMLNPSPYMFFFRFGEDYILGASPEMMVTVEGRTITERPIAGTRKRTWNAAKDQKLRDELIASDKERAEHVMLVDLCRNDIGRVAVPGTINVDELMVVEEYSHVFHLVSQVTGQLRPEIDSFAALEASFPNGTVSGAPKVRAMQLINQYEACGREFYAGCLGVHTFAGDLRSTLIIRAIHYRDGIASTQASAGIVWDSVAEHEWLETKNKMAATVEAIITTESV